MNAGIPAEESNHRRTKQQNEQQNRGRRGFFRAAGFIRKACSKVPDIIRLRGRIRTPGFTELIQQIVLFDAAMIRDLPEMEWDLADPESEEDNTVQVGAQSEGLYVDVQLHRWDGGCDVCFFSFGYAP